MKKIAISVLAGLFISSAIGLSIDAKAVTRNNQKRSNTARKTTTTKAKPAVTGKTTPVQESVMEPAPAELPATIVSIRVEPKTGNLVFQTEGGVLRPKLSVSQVNNLTHITLTSDQTQLDSSLSTDTIQLLADFQKAYPSLKAMTLQNNGQGVALGFDSDKPMKPRVLSNTGSLVTVTLNEPEPVAVAKASPVTAVKVVTRNPESGGCPCSVKNDVSSATPASTEQTASTVRVKNMQPSVEELISNPQTDGVVRQAWQDLQAGNPNSALLNLKGYLEKISDDQVARYVLAQALLATQDFSGAEKELRTLIRQNPKHLHAYISLIHTRLLPIQPPSVALREAEALVETALEQWPEHPQLLFHKALVLDKSGKTDEAKKYYRHSLAFDPINTNALARLANLELRTGSPYTAIHYYQEILGIDPNDNNTKTSLASLYLQLSDTEQAGKWFKNSFNPNALIGYAKWLQTQNKTEEALSVLKLAETVLTGQTNPDMVALFELGMLYSVMQQPKQAQQNLQQFVEWSVKPGIQTQPSQLDLKRQQDAQRTLKQLLNQSTAQPSQSATRSTEKTSSKKPAAPEAVKSEPVKTEPTAPAATPTEATPEKPSAE